MAIAELLSIEQYLRTSFEHDAELVEGRIVERPIPTWEHSRVHCFLNRSFGAMEHSAGFFVVVEQRVQTRAYRFRVPDVCVVLERPAGPAGRRIVTKPPYLCVEILSPEDTMADTLEKVREYLAFGVEWVWVIDPVTCTGEIHATAGASSVEDRVFTTDRFRIDLAQVEF
jgi:Uma2 family endonuclease